MLKANTHTFPKHQLCGVDIVRTNAPTE